MRRRPVAGHRRGRREALRDGRPGAVGPTGDRRGRRWRAVLPRLMVRCAGRRAGWGYRPAPLGRVD
ncbi:hypothetical protein, partial [Streptomyces sp. NPDC056190]|uniref:hypothetical protein n=1 Tax=Streptomyces sp. NPDC056190 TaxID=3345741 RepID=UPI0035D65176